MAEKAVASRGTFQHQCGMNVTPSVKMTVLYDNYVYREGTHAEWGFSCLIEGLEKTILFDTGGESDVLMKNMEILNVDAGAVDLVVISHNHWDHIGGLNIFLSKRKGIPVYLLDSSPSEIKTGVENTGATVISVTELMKVCEHAYLTGEMGTILKEQSLLIGTGKGTVIITGCSHQGIVDILNKAKEILDRNIYLVFGGFHLLNHSDDQMQGIIESFREIGVKKCGATHCTGDHQIELFREAFGEDYVRVGVGRVIEIE